MAARKRPPAHALIRVRDDLERRPDQRPPWCIVLVLALAPLAAIALVLVAALLAGPAAAQLPFAAACGDRADVLAQLEAKFKERPRARGMTRGGAVVELLVSDDGSFTILLTLPSSRTCLQATGEDWEDLPRPPPGKDA